MLDINEMETLLLDSPLQQTPIRLAVMGSEGFPRIVPLWFKYHQGAFYCVTTRTAWILRQLEKTPQVGFDISTNAPPYKGIRGSARVTLEPLKGPLLEQLIGGYLGDSSSSLAKWLLSRKEQEVVIKISPCQLSTWDYSQRMQDAVANA